jgi:lipid II:glycine glycyltransferase (peptidoglycan interpeptide bridge formation enzyme)
LFSFWKKRQDRKIKQSFYLLIIDYCLLPVLPVNLSLLFLQAQTNSCCMQCKVVKKEIQEIRKSNIVQQTAFWAKVKNQQGLEPIAVHYDASDDLLFPAKTGTRFVSDDLLILVNFIDDTHCIAYVPYGPKDEPQSENHGIFLEELSEVLRSWLPKNCILIRYDLPWENQWAKEHDFFDGNGNWIGPPPARSQEFRINFNTQNWNLIKSQSDNLPTNTFFLNLRNDQEKLMKNMKPKTRYNIRLSYRKGVQVKRYGLDKLDVWYALYRETALRNNITLHDKAYFHSVIEARKNDLSKGVDVELLMADSEGEYLAAMFLILSRKRGTYLYGASSSRSRNLMASYALQWEAIRIAQHEGCVEYDMFGAAPNANPSHPLHGLYRFKSGFGGHLYHRMGCWDYPLNHSKYKAFRAKEVNGQKYHIN